MRTVWSALNLYNRSDIYRLSHIVIRSVALPSNKTLILSFFKQERLIFGADEAGAVFRDTVLSWHGYCAYAR